jgi:ferric-dicitrate binding protein FerR (iron transport regulator)
LEAHIKKIAQYIIKYRKSTLTDKEQEELNAWRSLSKENEALFKSLTDDSYMLKLNIDVRTEHKKIKQLYKVDTGRSIPMGRSKFVSIAASIVILLTAGAVWLLLPAPVNKPVLSKIEPKKLPSSIPAVKKVSQPPKEVTLTLSNDSTVLLDKMAPGSQFNYQNSQVVKVNNEKLQIIPVTFNAPNMELSQVLDGIYNTIRVPNGRQYELVLADGSTVWLNAASTFSFPMTFSSNERRVELTGEAYFDVKPILLEGTKKLPFIVSVSGVTINVLGTQFNVTAYDDEPLTTTLVTGLINIKHGDSITPVQPGQQAIFNQGQLTGLQHADIETDTAWRNNQFVFRGTPLINIMRKISRWYDVNIDLECCQSTLYSITTSRDKKLSAFLKTMETMGDVQFKTEGNNIIVMSK